MNALKRCTKCGEEKPLSGFYKHKSSKDGYRGYCRVCHSISRKAYREANKKKIAVQGKKYRDNQTLQQKERMVEQKKANHLKQKFNMTLEDKRQMWREQGGKCLICKKRLVRGRDCHIDHCHVTLKIRGILCHRCNAVLGYASDDSTILRSAADYLERIL